MIVSYENNVTLLTSYCTNCEKKKEKIVSVTLRDKVKRFSVLLGVKPQREG